MARIALAQMNSVADVATNVAVADRLLTSAAHRGADLIALPEVFHFVGSRTEKLAAAEALDGPLVRHFRNLAREHGVLLLLGSMLERLTEDDRIANTSVLIDADGSVLAHYRKRNLFDVDLPGRSIRESDVYRAGTEPAPVVPTRIGRVGLSICFDLRFPGLYQQLRRDGAELLFVPSSFTFETGAVHWECLLRARAIETQCWVLAPAQTGTLPNGMRTWGHSLAVDPWGTVTAQMDDDVGICLAEVDLDRCSVARARIPLGLDLPQANGTGP